MLNKENSKGFIWRYNPGGTRTKKYIFNCKDCNTDIFVGLSQLKESTGYCNICTYKDSNRSLKNKGSVIFNEKGEKYCKFCDRFLPISKFSIKKGDERKIKKGVRNGYSTLCTKCQNVKSFGINSKIYDEILASQNNLCAICKSPEPCKGVHSEYIRQLAVDHDHKTGKLRALLCTPCNTALGALKDNILLFEEVIKYLKTHNEKNINI